MSLPRELIMKELGIAPVWKLKSDTSAPECGHASAVLEMDSRALKHAIQTCTACPLHASRIQGVVGIGDETADWLIVGEAPGEEENEQGEPFVGAAGHLLDAMLAAIDLKRGERVYITNVLKSHLPGNRTPTRAEIAACLPYLERQIQLIQPKIIVTLGAVAAHSLLKVETPLGELRGRVHHYQNIPLVVSYHPAYLLRSLLDKAKAWEDLCLARETMRGLG